MLIYKKIELLIAGCERIRLSTPPALKKQKKNEKI